MATITSTLASGAAAQDNDTWRFICVNDLHYSEPACRPWFDQIVAAMMASAPDAKFCLLAGDLTDAGKPDQMANIHAALLALDIPIYATPGNHDYVSETDRSAYDKHFPGHTNLSFEQSDWQIIGLDTCEGTHYANTKIHQGTLDWIDRTVPTLDRAKPTIVYTHFPLGLGVINRPTNADALLDKLAVLNVRAIFGGHWHAFTEKTWKNATCTTDKCCSRVRDNHDGTHEKGWFVCTVRGTTITRQFVQIPTI